MVNFRRIAQLMMLIAVIFFSTATNAAEKNFSPNIAAQSALPAMNANSYLANGTNKKDGNLCPICKRERSVCYEESLQAAQNPASGKKLCAVYKNTFVVGESRPHPCPICGLTVNLPQRSQRYENTDSDLCPHPGGNVLYMSEIVTCPRCGFSAFQKDFRTFRAKQHPETAEWIKTNLQPRMSEMLRHLLGKEIKIDEQDLLSLFELQKEIPDIFRCGNAYLIYRQRMENGDREVTDLGLARVAWMAAWANRRAVSAPFGQGALLESARRVQSAVQKFELSDNELEESIVKIRELLAEKNRFDILEQQILRITLAGYCNRLGLNAWAELSLQQVGKELEKNYRDAATDPWQKIKDAADYSGETKEKIIELAKTALTADVSVRQNCVKMEKSYLNNAVRLITTAFDQQQMSPPEIPTYLYLVGDFSRRAEQHSRALLYLTAADKAAFNGDEIKVEHLAPQQIALLKRYVSDRKITPPTNQFASEDTRRINAAGLLAKNAQAQNLATVAKKTVAPNVASAKQAQ